MYNTHRKIFSHSPVTSVTYQGRSDERVQSTWCVRPEFTQLCRDSRFFKCVTNNYAFIVTLPVVCSKLTDKME